MIQMHWLMTLMASMKNRLKSWSASVWLSFVVISFADPWPWDSWERSHKALQELCHLIPNFQKKIDKAEPEELSEYYSQVCFTISTAFSCKQKSSSSRLVPTMHVAMISITSGTTWPIGWINPNCGLLLPLPKTSATIVAFVMMLLAVFSVQLSLIGMIQSMFLFLIPSVLPVIWCWLKSAGHGDEHYDWLSSNHARTFYTNHKADPECLEHGFLKSSLLVKVHDLN